MRPSGKARRANIPPVFDRGATPPGQGPRRADCARWGGDGRQRASNAAGVAPRAASRGALHPPGVEANPRPGIYRIGPDGRAVAVNVDPRESTGATVRADDFEGLLDRAATTAGAAIDTRAVQTEARQSYWQYGLLLMLAALVAESFVGRA